MGLSKENVKEKLILPIKPLSVATVGSASVTGLGSWCPLPVLDGRRYLFGYVLPEYQRGFVWDVERQVRFIESICLGFFCGSILINWVPNGCSDEDRYHYDGLLLDGQQRLTTIDRFCDDEFGIFGGILYSELDGYVTDGGVSWGYHFRNNPVFSVGLVRSVDDVVCREIYHRLNFGGVAHEGGV